MSYPRYPAYKDSGVTWLGDVPLHWHVRPLKRLASVNNDVLLENLPGEFTLRYVDISSVDAVNGIVTKEEMLFENAPSRARRRVKDGDIIVSTVRTYLKAIARVEDPEDNLIVSTGFAVIRPSSALNSHYADYLCGASYFIEHVIARSVGVSYPAINTSDLMRIAIPTPPLREQAAIAAFLDRETATIAALIAKQERLIALLREKRQALIAHAVTKGLRADAPMQDSGVAWLGEVPAHWTVPRLKHVASVQTGLAKGKDYSDRATVAMPYMRVANVQAGYLDLSDVAEITVLESEVARYSLRRGDILMNEGGDNDKLGRGAVWEGRIEPCLHQNHVFAVRPHARDDAYWLSMLTQASYGRFFFLSRANQSTNLASISQSNLQELPVLMPPKNERADILAYLKCNMEQIDALIAKAQQAIALMREHRTSLIAAAVTGKIDVRGAMETQQVEVEALAGVTR